jgi:putative cell wall-binding protein
MVLRRALRVTGVGVAAVLVAAGPLGVPRRDAVAAASAGPVGQVVRRDDADGLIPTFRYNGRHRFDTARLIAGEADRADTVLIARGDLYPDALAGGYLAGVRHASILLTGTAALPADTLAALAERRPAKVVLIGGLQAIGPGVERQLSSLGYEVSRVGGADRYETAADVALAGGAVGLLDGLPAAILASGEDFPDALVAGAIAYDRRFPILLTPSERLHERTAAALAALGVRRVLITGGEAAVSATVAQRLQADGYEVVRVAGDTRVETALALADFTVNRLGWDPALPVFARGDDFADALTVGPRQGTRRDVLLLTANPTTLEGSEPTVTRFLKNRGCSYTEIGFAGGASRSARTSSRPSGRRRACATAARRSTPSPIPITDPAPAPIPPAPAPTPSPAPPVPPPASAVALTLEPADTFGTTLLPHTVTATLTEAGAPLADTDVMFELYRGPAPHVREEQAVGRTAADGTATYTFTSFVPEIDYVVACADPGADGTCLEVAGNHLELVADAPSDIQDGEATDWARVTGEEPSSG